MKEKMVKNLRQIFYEENGKIKYKTVDINYKKIYDYWDRYKLNLTNKDIHIPSVPSLRSL